VQSPFVYWPCLAGIVFFVAALFALRADIAAARGLDKLVVMGRVFLATSLAAFGAEHISGAQFVKTVVPAWMPAPLFWTYLVGSALLAVALAIVVKRHVRLAGLMYAAMLFLFVLLIHIRGIVAKPHDRIFWAVGLRDFSFAAGGLALAATASGWPRSLSSRTLTLVARFCIAIPMLVFAVEHFLHPQFALGIPLAKQTPAWVPAPAVWGYVTGAGLLIAGICILANKRARSAATWLGLLITLDTLAIYLPMLVLATGTAAQLEGVNYVSDTLLYAATILLLAAALPDGSNRAPYSP